MLPPFLFSGVGRKHAVHVSADAKYLLAMKCLAMRIGEEFQDLDDIRYLLRHIGLRKYEDALEIITRYYPLERFPQKALYALEELLEDDSSQAQ